MPTFLQLRVLKSDSWIIEEEFLKVAHKLLIYLTYLTLV